jgi:subtilisin family serine protease
MSRQLLAVPWGRPGGVYSAPGSLLVKLRLGEAPAHIPALTDVHTRLRAAATSVDGGPVDRVLRHFSDSLAVARVHVSAHSRFTPGRRGENYDHLEHATGLSRTLRVDLDRHAPIAHAVDALRSVATVESAQPHYLSVTPFRTALAATAAPPAASRAREIIGAAEALAYEPGDPAVVVGIVDTGVHLDHPELHHRLRRGRDLVTIGAEDVSGGVRVLAEPGGPGGEPEDNVGHGTACAGIIGALGEEIPPGLAGSCGVLPIRVLAGAVFPGRPQAVGIGAISDIDRGVKAAVDLGAVVVNMSFGTPEDELDPHDPRPHQDVVRYALARGCVLVAASGNSGGAGVFSPASLDGVIAVGAAQDDGSPAHFSTTGPQVALLAPGVRVVSSSLDGYAAVSGTSFASPFCAAAAALLVSHARSRAYALDSGEVARLLIDSARPHPRGTAPGNGAGLLQAHAALRLLDRHIDSRPDTEAN